jgi:hypothetical protein
MVNDRFVVEDKLVIIWKETVVDYFESISR